MPSLRSWILQGSAVSTFASICTFIVYTKHCHMHPVDRPTDPIFSSAAYRKFNPLQNPSLDDVCVRKIPLFKVRKELVEDAERGGGKLVERFCGGVWGCFGALIQRKYLQQKYRDASTQHMLWDKHELLESNYEEGTQILNHFEIVSKTPTSLLLRCGDSPLSHHDTPRASDGLFEITAHADLDRGFAEFRLKSVFFRGDEKVESSGIGKGVEFAHQMYTKLLMETGIKNCMY